jgi:adhesin/invasin
MADVVVRSPAGEVAVRVPQALASPGFFVNGAEVSVYRGNGAPVWDFAPGRSGEELVVFAGGLGAVSGEAAAGTPAPASPLAHALVVPTVRVDGRVAEVRFAGLTPGFIGLYQINFVVPAGTRAGRVPFVLEADGVSSPVASLPVAP